MRKFWIEFEKGKLLDLNGGVHVNPGGAQLTAEQQYLSRSLFLTDPSGLGVNIESDYQYTGAYAYACTRLQPGQIVVAGVLNVIPRGVDGAVIGSRASSVYSKYTTLVPMITGKIVTLRYCPFTTLTPDYNQAYRLDGYVTKLTKTEKQGGRLAIGFEFRSLTPWYQAGYGTMAAQTLSASSTYTIPAVGSYGAAFEMVFKASGAVGNFGAVIKRDNTEIGALIMSSSLTTGTEIIWSSDPASRRVTRQGVSALDVVDLSHNIYPLVKAGDVLQMSSSMTGSVSFTANFKAYYGGV